MLKQIEYAEISTKIKSKFCPLILLASYYGRWLWSGEDRPSDSIRQGHLQAHPVNHRCWVPFKEAILHSRLALIPRWTSKFFQQPNFQTKQRKPVF